MGKKKPSKKQQPANGEATAAPEGENVSAYFRRVFHENPTLLKGRSNHEILQRWLADHPGAKEVPVSVKYGLSNVKSVLRSKGRKRKAAKAAATTVSPAQAHPVTMARAPKKTSGMEALEEHIDESL